MAVPRRTPLALAFLAAAALAAGPVRADDGLPCLRLGADLDAYVAPLLAEGWTLAQGDDRLRAMEGPALLLHAATIYPDPPATPAARAARVAEARDFEAGRYPDAAVLTRGDAALLVHVEAIPGLGHRALCMMAAPSLPRAAALLAGATPGPFGDLAVASTTASAAAETVRVDAMRLGWAADLPEPLPGAEGILVLLTAPDAP